ncbi:MAG: hypothetical protein KAH44_29580, partial [Oricola sp.]|nr:hypothetical protein [Oricola sp.]
IAAAIFAWARDHQAATPASGLRHVFSVFGAPDLSPSFFALLALAAVSASCLAGRKRARALKPADMLMIAAAASLALAPLAPSSFVLLGVLVFYAAGLPAPRGAVALLGCVLAWRAGGLPVSGALDGGLYGFLSVAAFALALAAAATAPTRKPQTAPARAPRLPANVILFRASRESSSPS